MKKWLAMAFAVFSCANSLHAKSYFNDSILNSQKALLSRTAESPDTDRIVLFGDSLSDTEGRFLKRSLGFIPDPKYHWEGRHSNGPLWIEYVSGALDVPVLNYSMAAARIEIENNLGVIPECKFLGQLKVPSGFDQMGEFTRDHGRFNENDLVMISLGPNDYIFQARNEMIEAYVHSIASLAEKAIQKGAKKVLVFKLPENIKFRSAGSKDGKGKNVSNEALTPMVDKHNALLAFAMIDLQSRYPDTLVSLMTTDSKVLGARTDPESFGIKELKEPCFTGSKVTGTNLFDPNGPRSKVCPHPRDHIFWDGSHPTTFVHCLSGVEVLEQMESLGIARGVLAAEAESRCKSIP